MKIIIKHSKSEYHQKYQFDAVYQLAHMRCALLLFF